MICSSLPPIASCQQETHRVVLDDQPLILIPERHQVRRPTAGVSLQQSIQHGSDSA